MARRNDLVTIMTRTARELERQEKARLREQTRIAKDAERAQKAYLRAREQAAKTAIKERQAQEKERARLYTEARVTSVELQNELLEEQVARLNSLLLETLSVDDFLDLDTLKQKPDIPYFITPDLGKPEAEPKIDPYLPTEPTGINKLLPGVKKKYEQAVQSATVRYKEILDAYHKRQAERQRKLDQAKAEHERKVKAIVEDVEAHNAQIEELKKEFADGKPDAIVNYFTLILGASSYPEDFPQKAKIAYVPESNVFRLSREKQKLR